jgi:hypothetical protein
MLVGIFGSSRAVDFTGPNIHEPLSNHGDRLQLSNKQFRVDWRKHESGKNLFEGSKFE